MDENTLIPFPSTRELCHWCAEYKNGVETMILSPKAAQAFERTTLKVCHHCIESWAYWAADAEKKRRFKMKGRR